MTQNVQIFGAGVQGRSPVVTASRRVNAYVEIERQPDRSRVTFHGMPGLELFSRLGGEPIRGMFSRGPYLYVAHRGELRRVRNDKVNSKLGDLDTTQGHVFFTDNNAGEMLLVDGTSGYTYDTGTATFAKVVDADFPANPRGCTTIQDYAVVPYGDNGEFALSALNDFTAYAALDFDVASAHPDGLVAVHAHLGGLALLGEESIEYWQYTGAADFPLARTIGTNFGYGLAAAASVVKLGSAAFALLRRNMGDQGPGALVVGRLAGAEPEIVSDSELEHVLAGYTTVSDAVGAAFSVAGHPMYQLSFPAEGRTWVYDDKTGVWSERASHGLAYHRGVVGAWHNGAMYWGDHDEGIIWKETPTVLIEGQDDDGNDRPVIWKLVSNHVHQPNNRRFTVPFIEFDLEVGKGVQSGQGSAPKAMLRTSSDKGVSWSAERTVSIGAAGKYHTRPRFNRLGQYRDFTCELAVSDPVPRVLTGEALGGIGGRL